MPTKKASTTDEPEVEEVAVDEEAAAEPDPYRFSGLAMPAPSDPLNPDYLDWMHAEAAGPAPDEIEGIKQAQTETTVPATDTEPEPA